MNPQHIKLNQAINIKSTCTYHSFSLLIVTSTFIMYSTVLCINGYKYNLLVHNTVLYDDERQCYYQTKRKIKPCAYKNQEKNIQTISTYKPKERLNQQTNPVHKNNLEKNIQPTSTYKTEINIKPTFAYKTKPSKE